VSAHQEPLSSDDGRRAMLQSIVALVLAVFGAKACSIMRFDEKSRELVFEAVAGEGEDTLVGRRIPASTGIAGWSLASEEPISIDDVLSHPRFDREVAEQTGYVPTKLTVFPLLYGEESLGVLSVLDAGATAHFFVSATACTPLAYQWFFNCLILTNETNCALVIASVDPTNSGNYFVIASASGGSTTSAVATLTVNLIPPGITGVAANVDGSFNLNLFGTPGYTYILEATTNLFPPGNWLSVATNTLGTNGVWQFTDTSATNFPQQFYRLKLAP